MKSIKNKLQVEHTKSVHKNNNNNTLHKWWKALGAAGLAVFMGGMGLFGALGAPANASAASGPDSAAATAGADPFGLDPQNDQVIADLGGIEIKYHNLLGTSVNDGTIHPQLPGLPYVTMGAYNYLIIGMHSSFLSYDFRDNPVNDVVQDGNQFDKLDLTPAGQAIARDYFNLSGVATSDRIDEDLKPGQMLCLCSTYATSLRYYESNVNALYEGSNLQKHMEDTIYAGLSDTEKKFVATVTLNTQYLTAPSFASLANQHVFAVAGANQTSENFHILNYLPSGAKIAVPGAQWLTRSGATNHNYSAICVTTAGGFTYTNTGSSSHSVRPAFVLQI